MRPLAAAFGLPALLTLALLAPAAPARAAGHLLTVGPGQPFTSIGAALQAAAPGDTIRVEPGLYREHLTIDRPVTLLGRGEPVIDGGGTGTVVKITAPGVTVQGFRVQGSGTSHDREDTAIAVGAGGAVIRDNTITDALFGIYLRQAPDSLVAGNTIRGRTDLSEAERGDSIKAWYSGRVRVIDNTVQGGRDTILWYTDDCLVRGNRIEGGRYGLHFMYSNRCRVEENVLQGNSVGAYVMYGDGITFRRNSFSDHRGPSGYGLGLKEVDSVTAEGNWFVRNRVGVYADTTPLSPDSENRFHANAFVGNEIGLYLLPSDHRNSFWENSFIDNQEQVAEGGTGPLTGNAWSVHGRGNYWSDYTGYDRQGEGVGDLPYRDRSAFAAAADRYSPLRWFIYSPAAAAVDLAARAFPVAEIPPHVIDPAPLTRPVLPGAVQPTAALPPWPLLAVSLGMLAAAVLGIALACRRVPHRSHRTPPVGEVWPS